MTARRSSRPQYDAGDVLIIGGGATGVLTALEIHRRDPGKRCTLVECKGFGAGQSGHSHGYLHDGYAYLDANQGLVDALRAGSDRWLEICRAHDVAAETEASKIVFADPVNAAAATELWRARGLPVEDDAPYRVILPDVARAAYRTRERSYDFRRIFEGLKKQLYAAGVTTVYGEATRVLASEQNVTGVDATVAGRPVRLHAGSYVLAAGSGNEKLIEDSANYRGRAVSRVSHMLVLSSRGLPRMSVIFPEAQMYGLFIVSRQVGARMVWLVSNFHSYGSASRRRRRRTGDVGTLMRRLWLKGTLRVLTRAFEVDIRDRHQDLELALYSAPKMELRPRPGELNTYASEAYRFRNLQVVAPTKLTLAPVLAAEVAEKALANRTGEIPPAAVGVERVAADVGELREQWRANGTVGVARFLKRYNLDQEALRAEAWV